MLRLMAEQERDELKIQYEERLKREAESVIIIILAYVI